MIKPLWSGTTALDLRQAYRARDPKQVVLDPAGEKLHDMFLDLLELNSVETEFTAVKIGRVFVTAFKKKLESTQPRVSSRLC